MEPTDLSARLRFLNESSHLLSMSAPTTSSYLMSRHNALLLDNNMDISDTQTQKACGACGTLFVVGGKVTTKTLGKKNSKSKTKEPLDRPRNLVFKCRTCDATTSFPIPPAPKVIRKPAIPVSVSSLPSQVQPAAAITPSVQKKRSKAAKHGGLKALLQKKKESTAASGFDLMDFMKTTG